MTAFDRAWGLTKDFRYLLQELRDKRKAGEPVNMWDEMRAMQTLGQYDNQTGEISANLNASELQRTNKGRGWMRDTTDEEKENILLETLRHEGDHKALNPLLIDALQPRNHPIPYKADTSKPNSELKEEFEGKYMRGHEYALMALDSMRRRKGSGKPRMKIGTTVAPNRRFRRLSGRYDHYGYDLADLISLERKTPAKGMNEAMGHRARANAKERIQL
tara:strand:- start:224 stop:877 length:654 start_codon:yes stop_codon:yes gene_type:complete